LARNAEQVLRELLFVHQLRPRHAEQLDADAHEAHVVDVRRDIRAGPGEAHPRLVGARLREHAVPELGRQAVVHDELCAQHALRLGVAAALEAARFPQLAHLLLEARDDRIDELLFVGQQLFFGELQALVQPLAVDQRRGQVGNRVAQQRVEGGPHEGIDAALQLHQRHRGVGQPVQKGRTGVCRWYRAAGVRIHGFPCRFASGA
jgi:hypothetical protein